MNQNKKSLYQEESAAVILRDIFQWIRNALDVKFPNQLISDYSYLSEAGNMEAICRINSAFGTGKRISKW